MSNYSHVHEDSRKHFELSDHDRVYVCLHDIWIKHPNAERLINSIHFSLKMTNRITSPCMLCIAPGGAGKTAVITELKTRNIFSEYKMLFVTMHINPNNYSLRDLILVEMGLGVGRRARQGENLTPEMQNLIKFQKIRGIVIDEVHDALYLTSTQQSQNLSLLKNLSSQIYGLSVFAFGIPKAARVLRHDAQVRRRYAVRSLARWENGDEYRNFVASYINRLPLKKPTNYKDQALFIKIFEKSLGITDNIVKILQASAAAAVVDGCECITHFHIDNIEALMEVVNLSLRDLDEDDSYDSD